MDINKIDKNKHMNFIISSIILGQKESFTHKKIMNEIVEKLNMSEGLIKIHLDNALIRMRNDGFLKVLGSNYSVIEINI